MTCKAYEYMIRELIIRENERRYSDIRNEALAYAFSYMNLIEHWGSGIPRIISKVKAFSLPEPEFIGGDVDLRINIYRNQENTISYSIGCNAGDSNKFIISGTDNAGKQSTECR